MGIFGKSQTEKIKDSILLNIRNDLYNYFKFHDFEKELNTLRDLETNTKNQNDKDTLSKTKNFLEKLNSLLNINPNSFNYFIMNIIYDISRYLKEGQDTQIEKNIDTAIEIQELKFKIQNIESQLKDFYLQLKHANQYSNESEVTFLVSKIKILKAQKETETLDFNTILASEAGRNLYNATRNRLKKLKDNSLTPIEVQTTLIGLKEIESISIQTTSRTDEIQAAALGNKNKKDIFAEARELMKDESRINKKDKKDKKDGFEKIEEKLEKEKKKVKI
jgi:hypothetical protein